MPLMQHISIGGRNIQTVTMQQEAGRGLDLRAPGGGAVYTPNAEMAKLALDDPAFLALLNRGDLVVPDGAGVVLAAKLLGTPLAGKVAGVELAQNLLAPMQQRGLSLFLFGGKPGVAQRAAQAVRAKYPGLAVCGVADGYFDDEAQRVSLIAQSGADVVFVCLGSPSRSILSTRTGGSAMPSCWASAGRWTFWPARQNAPPPFLWSTIWSGSTGGPST